MKIFSIASVGLAAVVSGYSDVARAPRAAGTSIELNGFETSDEIMALIMDVAGDARDEVDEAIQAMMGVDRNMNIMQVRKFRGLKLITLWLLAEPLFGRFCYYGCYCLPEGSHNIARGGYGKPLDDIDAACFDFKKCYKCLIDEFQGDNFVSNQFNLGYIPKEECAGEHIGYGHELMEDGDGARWIKCKNPVGSCRRAICECDKALAMAFAKYEADWDESLHEVKGGFDREANCHRGPGGGSPFEECCGDKTTFPLNQIKHADQCCDGVEAKPEGTC
jgi:hypothetical protein